LPQVILEGLIVALGIGFAEELLFRGWLLDELQRDYRPRVALWVDALIYAALHFIKPLAEILRTLPGFPALLLLGLTFVWAKRSHRSRLGLPIGLHSGLVWGRWWNILVKFLTGLLALTTTRLLGSWGCCF